MLRKISDNSIALVLPPSFRIVFGVITVILIASMATLDALTPVPLVIAGITLFAWLYEERWRFYNEEKRIEHRFGLIFLAKRSFVAYDNIDTFVLSNFRVIPDDHTFSARKTVAARSLVSFQVLLKDGGYRTIEIRPNRHNDSLRSNAETIAEFCEISLQQVD